MNQLQLAMRANGLFSLMSGLVLVIATDTVDGWLGVGAPTVLRLFGIVLLGHAVLLAWAANRPDPRPLARLNLVAIAPYPLMMAAILVTGIVDTGIGRVLVAADGLIIAGIAAMHWRALQTPSRAVAPIPA